MWRRRKLHSFLSPNYSFRLGFEAIGTIPVLSIVVRMDECDQDYVAHLIRMALSFHLLIYYSFPLLRFIQFFV